MATSDTNVKLSNVIGAPFSDYVLLQLYIRAAQNSTVSRSNDDILFLANKTGWARLVSSVNIELQPTSNLLKLTDKDYKTYYSRFNLDSTLSYNAPDSLAKNWILEAGTSIQKGNGINLRSGIGPDGAYGLGGTEEMGYRPLPGLTGVTIETTGRLGSLRQANIQFKVWNMNQLNVIEALYFRLGYSMLLEWGHTQYYENNGGFNRIAFGIDDPFKGNQRKENIQQAIAFQARNTFGNYDGMLGIVSNFNWSMNQDGGYDCSVKLVGLGSVMDSMRINQAYKLPDGLLKEYKKSKSEYAQIQAQLAETKRLLKELQDNPPKGETTSTTQIDPVPVTVPELFARAQKYDGLQGDFAAFVKTYGIAPLVKKYQFLYPSNIGVYIPKGDDINIDFYAFNIPFTKNTNPDVKNAVSVAYGGLWLNKAPYGFKRYTPSTITSIKFDTELLSKAIRGILEGNGGNSEDIRGKIRSLEDKMDSYTGAVKGWSFTTATKYFAANTDTTKAVTATGEWLKGQAGIGSLTAFDLMNVIGIGTKTVDLPLTGVVPGGKVEAVYSFLVAPVRIDETNRLFPFSNTTIQASWTDTSFQPTRADILVALDQWQIDGSRLDNVTYSGVGSDFKISGTTTYYIVANYNGLESNRAASEALNPGYNGDKSKKKVPITFKVTTNNPGFIADVLTPIPPADTNPKPKDTANTGDTNGTVNKASTDQQEAVEGFASALQAMLTIVQAVAQVAIAKSNVKGLAVNISALTEKFFQDGIMNGVLNDSNIPKRFADLKEKDFLVAYASRGFNSNLMIDPTLYDIIPKVDYTKLCTAFAFAYGQGGEEGSDTVLYSPIYIPFGYLLAFLNNMCLIYDSPDSKLTTNNNAATGTPKRPYVYIDFNPETNFCLTSPQQLSVDPLTCLVPLQATKPQYESIFPENVVKNWRGTDKATPIFDPAGKFNGVSTLIKKAGLTYKTQTDTYQGRIMDILLNVDYLLGLVKNSAGADPEHAVKLEPFLQQILVDINKSLGNTNAFRSAYRDDSNTIQIQDDQWVPSLNGTEASILGAEKYKSNLKEGNNKKLAGLLPISSDPQELPVAGNLGLARQFQLKSVMSTKLASMIAISAQANTGSVNAKDHSSLSYLNENFQDRYKPYIQDASNGESGNNSNSKNNEESNDQRAAELFNDHIINIYSNFKLNTDRIALAKNYYIERMSKVKSGDVITSAAPFIPAELEMTLDGISGIIMGNAFTIPQNRLPLSLRGRDGLAKVAFIVTGLTHTIQNNQWLTKIKGQMIKLRNEVKQVTASTLVGEIQSQEINVSSRSDNPRGTDLFKATNSLKTSTYLFGAAKSGLAYDTPAHPNWGDLPEIWQNNNAWDLGVAAGTPVYAIADGTISNVKFSENNNTVWGYSLTIGSSNNTFFYTHLDSVVVPAGTNVKKGDLVAYVGQWPSNYSSRLQGYPHLHIGLKTGKLLTYIDNTGKLL